MSKVVHHTPKVSIIVPVFRAEIYIERCIRTLFTQTLDDIEYIFVDDCSPDNSIDTILGILEEYPERKPQVKIVRHKCNQGVAAARQHGMESATGDYIIHCDPDDWVEPTMYEELYQHALTRDTDMVWCDFYRETEYGQIIEYQAIDSLTTDCLLGELCKGKIYGATWNKLIRRNILVKYNITFIPLLNVCEDLWFFIQLLNKGITISHINRPLYHYDFISNPNSIIRKGLSNHIKLDETQIELANKLLCGENKRIIIGGNLFHIFLIADLSNSEFKDRYKKYHRILYNNTGVPKDHLPFLWLALHGHFKMSQKLFYFFLNNKLRLRKWLKAKFH